MSKTQKVRIAVAIDSRGQWYDVGFGPRRRVAQTQKNAVSHAKGMLDSWLPTDFVIIEAELPIPEPKTVPGKVRKVADA